MTWRLLVVHPGSPWSTADVFDGLCRGLAAQGVEIVLYRLDHRIAKAQDETTSTSDVLRVAASGLSDMAAHAGVDAVVIVSGTMLHAEALLDLRASGLPVFLLFTESPYDHAQEMQMAALVDGCWTHERTSVAEFLTACRHAWYLPHGWHPDRHYVGLGSPNVPQHDVVFVGSGFPERITWFNAIDWTGIDLGLYGFWADMGLKDALVGAVHHGPIDNARAADLYRRAKIGLNLYRWPRGATRTGDSLNPRAYELAACGCFSLSAARAEIVEVFDDLVPFFTTPAEAQRLVRYWLSDDPCRRSVAYQLPAPVASASWIQRARQVLTDLQGAGLAPRGRTAAAAGDAWTGLASLRPFASSPAWLGASA